MANKLSQRTVYPMLEATTCTVSPRSRLYRIEPIGIGTPFTEGLTSYVCRLAKAHHITMAVLFEEILVPTLGKDYLSSPEHQSVGSRLNGGGKYGFNNVNGMGGVPNDWIAAVESLTLQHNLRFLTLTSWSDVLPPYLLLRTYLAWCPECFEEDRINGRIIYIPLIWHLSAIEVCSRHRRKLIDICPSCGKHLPILSRRSFPGFCSRCTTWLGSSNEPRQEAMSDTVIGWHEAVTINVGELIAKAPSINSPTKAGIEKILQASTDKLFAGKLIRLAQFLGKSAPTVYGWHHGRFRTPLWDLLKICYCIDVPLMSILLGDEHVLETLSQARPLPKEIHFRVQRQPTKRLNYSEIEVKLHSFILDDIAPISVREAAKIVGCSYRTLHLKFPKLCNIIAARYKNAEKKRLENKRKQLETDVRHALSELRIKGINPSMMEIAKFLGNPALRHDRISRAILRTAIRE